MRLAFKYWISSIILALTPFTAWSYSFDYSLNTSLLAGYSGMLAFDFIDGDTAQNNTIQLSNLITDGDLNVGLPIKQGDVSGAFATHVTLRDGGFFNELLQPILFGNAVTFHVETTEEWNLSAPLPDALSLFILDVTGTSPLATTTDPTGANAIFVLSLDGNGDEYTITGVQPPNPVPLPGTAGLMLLAAAWFTALNRARA